MEDTINSDSDSEAREIADPADTAETHGLEEAIEGPDTVVADTTDALDTTDLAGVVDPTGPQQEEETPKAVCLNYL